MMGHLEKKDREKVDGVEDIVEEMAGISVFGDGSSDGDRESSSEDEYDDEGEAWVHPQETVAVATRSGCTSSRNRG